MRVRVAFVALVVVVLAGCGALGPDVTWDSTNMGCTLEPVEGALVDVAGRTSLENPRYLNNALEGPLFVRWPAGWQVRSSAPGLDVVDAAGTVRYRTGENVSLSVSFDAMHIPGAGPEDGALLACGVSR